jgi:hypothetical protein
VFLFGRHTDMREQWAYRFPAETRILPGQRHKLWNTGAEPLRLLCCCAPAYEHNDTIITEDNPS